MTERLSLTNAVIKYGNTTAINNVTLKAHAGEMIFVTGTNGSGKSTLTRGIAGLLPLYSGELERTGKMSYVPQIEEADRDFPATVLEIVMTGTQRRHKIFYSRSDKNRALTIMNELQISDLSGREIRSLSGGQMRRVIVARALCGCPELLLLDEPCAGLDANSHKILFDVLRKTLSSGCAVIMVTHDNSDLDGIHNARVITLSNGKIIHDE